MHDESIHFPTEAAMLKDSRKRANDGKTEMLPKSDRSQVGANDKIELHGGKIRLTRPFDSVLGQRAPYAVPGCVRGHHESGIRYMRAEARLIWLHERSADNRAVLFIDGHEDAGGRGQHPLLTRTRLVNVRRENKSISSANDPVEDGPNAIEPIGRFRFANDQLHFDHSGLPFGSMPEVTRAGEDHRDVPIVRRGDDVVIANGTAGLNRAGRAGIGRREEPVRKGEKRITGHCAVG